MARREDRKPLAMSALCRTANARKGVALCDLSSHGCRVVLDGAELAVGQHIMLRPEGLEALSGVVRWVKEQFAGVEFDYPLHPAVVDHLCGLHPDDSLVELELAA